MSETTTGAEVTAIERAATLKLARDAYRACGCEGFARVDFLLAGEQLVVSEINTIPGFTPISLFPTLPAAAGYDFAAVCRRVVDLALERGRRPRPPRRHHRRPAPLTMTRRSAGPVSPRPPSALRPGARPGGGVRRTPTVRRRSAGLTPVRAGALLALLVALAGMYGATRSDAFTLRRTAITGVTWTTEDAVRSALAIPDGQNLFTLGTSELERRLKTIPAIRGASISVVLPDELRVAVAERVPLLAWKAGGQRYLVDQDGLLFAQVDDTTAAQAAELPEVDDQRAEAAPARDGLDARPGDPRRGPAPRIAATRRTSAPPPRSSPSGSTTRTGS